jgi:ABC-type dipeptide/oligopeptide/nickel transport system permease subunit
MTDAAPQPSMPDVWFRDVPPRAPHLDDAAALTPWRRFLRRFRRQRLAMAALGFLLLLVLTAVFAPLLAPHDPLTQDLRNALASPSRSHLLGTDSLGRDILSRLVYASRISLYAAFLAVTIAAVIGVPIGIVAGYLGGKVDALVSMVNDSFMGFPPILLAIGVVGALGPNLRNAMVAVGIVNIPRFVRVARGAVLAMRGDTYLEAARSIGAPTGFILRRHVLPNILSPVIVQVSLLAGFAMLAEASLSFLGLGVQPPDASWGAMLREASTQVQRQNLLAIWPGIALAVTVLAFNLLGDGLRDSFGREARR